MHDTAARPSSSAPRITPLHRVAIAAAALALSGLLAACSSGGGTPNLVGTWTGSYTFPEASGGKVESPLSIVITKQDGLLLYGYEEWQDDGKAQRADLVGSLSAENSSFVLAEGGGFFSGAVDGDEMVVRFIRTVEGSSTTFETRLTRQAG